MSADIAALPHLTALIAAITAAGGHAYAPGDARKVVPTPSFYTEVYVMAGTDQNPRVGALGGITPARVITRNVAQSQHNAENERAKVAAALLGKTVSVAGEVFGPLRREIADDPIGDDGDGWWSGSSSWTYA